MRIVFQNTFFLGQTSWYCGQGSTWVTNRWYLPATYLVYTAKANETWCLPPVSGNQKKSRIQQLQLYGCFLKWRYPQNTPKWSFLVGKPMVIGYQHFRKPPYANSSDFEPMGYNSGYGNHFLHLDLMTNPPESLHQDRLILFHFQTSVGQLFWGWCWKYIYTSQKSFK